MFFTIQVVQENKNVVFEKSAQDELFAVYDGEYQKGDSISLFCDEENVLVIVQLDDCMEKAFCLLKKKYILPIPFDEKKTSYNPKSFSGTRHYLYVRKARLEEIALRKNLAFNPYDCHENTGLFPHAFANVETRGESVFAARNAIDGFLANTFHGEWPYSSWGINKNPQAELHLDFGRRVLLDTVVLYLRADFPHDAWWENATITFDDKSSISLKLEKTGGSQTFSFLPKVVSALTLHSLKKADDPSPFPALTQIEVFGTEV